MKLISSSSLLVTLAALSSSNTNAFSSLRQLNLGPSTTTKLSTQKSEENPKTVQDLWQNQLGKFLTTGLVTASLWAAPAALVSNNNNFDVTPQIFTSSVANAKQMASASGSRVNKDPESLLRYGLPINSKEVRQRETAAAISVFLLVVYLARVIWFCVDSLLLLLCLQLRFFRLQKKINRSVNCKVKLRPSNKTLVPNANRQPWIMSKRSNACWAMPIYPNLVATPNFALPLLKKLEPKLNPPQMAWKTPWTHKMEVTRNDKPWTRPMPHKNACPSCWRPWKRIWCPKITRSRFRMPTKICLN